MIISWGLPIILVPERGTAAPERVVRGELAGPAVPVRPNPGRPKLFRFDASANRMGLLLSADRSDAVGAGDADVVGAADVCCTLTGLRRDPEGMDMPACWNNAIVEVLSADGEG